MDLDRMKYGELQKLAKSAGIKANVKIDKLVKALKEYYTKQKEVQHFQKAGQDENGTEKLSPSEEDLKQSAATELDKKENAQTISTRRKKGKKREKDPGNTKSVNISHSYPAGEPLSKRKRHSTFELEKSTLGSPATPDIDHTVRKNAPGSSTTALNQNRKIMTPRFMSPGIRECKVMGSKCATPKIVPQTKNSQNVSAREQAKGKEQNLTGSHSGKGKKKNQINSSPGSVLRTPSEMIEVTPVLHPSLELDCMKTGKDTSPGTQKIMDTISGEMSSAERREKLMNAIDMKIEEKYKNSPQKTPPTQIPRFVAFLEQRKQEQKKPITPGNKDWQKVHKKEFSKFDSIDVYLEKKRKRTEELSGSVKRTCTVLHEVQEVVTRLKNSRTPSLGKKQALHAFRPTVVSTKDMNLNFVGSPMKKIHTDKNAQGVKPFQPTVISTKDMNLNFASFKTPVKNAAVKPVSTGPTSARKSFGVSTVKISSARKSLGASAVRIKSPFKFTASFNTSEVTSASKPKFDLKASLARPMTWKPHTGKLKALEIKPYGDKGAEFTNNGLDKSVSKRMELYKTHTSHKKMERRALVTANRTLKKDNLQMKKRGISAKQ